MTTLRFWWWFVGLVFGLRQFLCQWQTASESDIVAPPNQSKVLAGSRRNHQTIPRLSGVCGLLMVVLLLEAQTSQAMTRYTITDLGTCCISVDNIPRLWRYLLCEEALAGLPEDVKARLKTC